MSTKVWSDHWQRARESPERRALRNVAGKPNTGGGEPIPAGEKWTVEERDLEQPRRGDGTFGYKADIGEERKYADHGQHKTKPLNWTDEDWLMAKTQAENGIRAGDVFEKGGREYVAIADLSSKQIMAYYTACKGPEGKLLISDYFVEGKKAKGDGSSSLFKESYRSTGRRAETLTWKQVDSMLESRGVDFFTAKYAAKGMAEYFEQRAMEESLKDPSIKVGDERVVDEDTGETKIIKGKKSIMRDYVSRFGYNGETGKASQQRQQQAIKVFNKAFPNVNILSINVRRDPVTHEYSGFEIPGLMKGNGEQDIVGRIFNQRAKADARPTAPLLGDRMQRHMDRGDTGFFTSTSHGYNKKVLANVADFMKANGLTQDQVLDMVRQKKLTFDQKTGRISIKKEPRASSRAKREGYDLDYGDW